MSKKKISFMCTAFRDGFQSVYGARVHTHDFLPAVQAAREAGINYFEAGGGARFQSLYFYCNEDAFDMMDQFRATAGPDANLQTLARGTNVVGLESQSSDVIEMHARLFARHGMTTIRNFDALNDVNNLIYSGKVIVDAGLKHQVCVTMMELPPGCRGAHGPDFYTETLRQILDAGIAFDSVCFKDASGTSAPTKVKATIERARKMLPEDISIHFHTHETAGVGVAGYLAALEGGADAIDLSMAPCSGGTCQPDILTMWHALRGTDFDLDIDVEKVREAEAVFKDCMKHYFLPPEATAVEPLIPWSPMPGGALTANTQMMRDNKILDKFPEVIAAMGDVVRSGGFGTSVTPVSQFYFQQAFNNVMFGPWEKIAEGYGKMVLGYFGRTPVSPDPKIVKLAQEQLGLEPTEKTPLEINDADPSKGLGPATEKVKAAGLPTTDENVFIVATCGDKGIAFLKGEAEVGVRKIVPETEAKEKADEAAKVVEPGQAYAVTVNHKKYSMTFEDNKAIVNGKVYVVDMHPEDGAPAIAAAAPAAAPSGEGAEVKSQMPGQVIKIVAATGTQVAEGDTVLILEAMKMEMKISAPVAGTVTAVNVGQGDQVEEGQILAVIG